MNKTAAIRSQARRAVLVKAAIDPTQIAGALAMAGGGALGGSAVTDDDQSMLKRIGKGTLGAALGYGGYKLMTDPRWQQGLRNGVGTARNLIAGLLSKTKGVAKAAEANPTPEEQAFVAGFCKAAEAMGVDPEALYKEALPAWLGRAGQAILGGAKRVGSWIGSHGGNAVAQSRAGQAVTSGAKRFGQLLAGGADPVRGAFRMGRGDLSGMDKLRGWLGTYLQGLKGGMGKDVASELRKSLAARVGTGAAAIGGGAMLLGGGDDGQ